MSDVNKLSADAVKQAQDAQTGVQDANAQLFNALVNAPNQNPATFRDEAEKAKYNSLVGKTFVKTKNNATASAVGNETATEFSVDDLPAKHRYYYQGDMVTQDFDTNRCSVVLDKDNKCIDVRWE